MSSPSSVLICCTGLYLSASTTSLIDSLSIIFPNWSYTLFSLNPGPNSASSDGKEPVSTVYSSSFIPASWRILFKSICSICSSFANLVLIKLKTSSLYLSYKSTNACFAVSTSPPNMFLISLALLTLKPATLNGLVSKVITYALLLALSPTGLISFSSAGNLCNAFSLPFAVIANPVVGNWNLASGPSISF